MVPARSRGRTQHRLELDLRASDPEGLELANLRGLQLSGPKAFDRVVPLRTPGALTTIPAAMRLFGQRSVSGRAA